MQCPLPDQPVDSQVWACQAQAVEAKVDNGFVHPEDGGSFRFGLWIRILHLRTIQLVTITTQFTQKLHIIWTALGPSGLLDSV